MGAGRSRSIPISYEEACRRAGQDVVKRLRETFDRYASNTGLLPQTTFIRDVFGDGMPVKLAEAMYAGFSSGNQKGIRFDEVLRGLVLIVHGTKDEKADFLAYLFTENDMIMKETIQRFIAACDIDPSPISMDTLFTTEAWCSPAQFSTWVKDHPNLASFTKWLLLEREEGEGMKLVADPDPPTFYQTLAKKYAVCDKDVMDLEKAYWGLKSGSSKFDVDLMRKAISPPLPDELCDTLFEVLDINGDGHIDLGELVRGVAMCCRRSYRDRVKFCFQLLDKDKDGYLNRHELTSAVQMLLKVREENWPAGTRGQHKKETKPSQGREAAGGRGREEKDGSSAGEDEDAPPQKSMSTADVLLRFEPSLQERGISEDQFVHWATREEDGRDLVGVLLQVIVEVSHVKFGLRPLSTQDEAAIVRGYMTRFDKTCRCTKGSTVYLIAADWFNSWRLYTNYEMEEVSLQTLRERQKQAPPSASTGQRGSKPPLSSRTRQPSASSFSSSSSIPNQRKPTGNGYGTTPVALGEFATAEAVEIVEVGECTEIGEEPEEVYTHIVAPSTTGFICPLLCAASPGGTVPTSSLPLHPSHDERDRDGQKLDMVDNSSLCVQEIFPGSKKLISLTSEGGHLIKDKQLREFVHYYVVPEDIWKAMVTWYGSAGYSSGPPLPRTVVSDDRDLELYPVTFRIYKHTTHAPASKSTKGPWISFLQMLNSVGIATSYGTGNEQTQVATIGMPGDPAQPLLPHRVLYYQASFNRGTTLAQMCERFQTVLHTKPEDLRLYDLKDIDSPELLDEEEKTVEEMGFKDGHSLLVEIRSRDNSWPEELIAMFREVQEKDENKVKQKQGPVKVTPGATGLSNLGNTCFMNSSLQCMSNTRPLTNYFKAKDHLIELNKQNPLGTGGVLAKRYSDLVHDLWDGHSKSITPLKFRFTLAKHASQFNNFQQQDAQELLSFVLDGIHEDLNRVKEKPYVELPDSDGRPDAVVAEEAWKYHIQRNDSIIVDLFHGQLKSVLECKECHQTSVKFDPFTFLSLPLPLESTINLEVIVVRLDGSQPVRYCLKQRMEDRYHNLREQLSQMASIHCNHFILVDVYGGTIRNFPQDTMKIGTILSGWLYAFEMPKHVVVMSTCQPQSSNRIPRNEPGRKLLSSGDQDGKEEGQEEKEMVPVRNNPKADKEMSTAKEPDQKLSHEMEVTDHEDTVGSKKTLDNSSSDQQNPGSSKEVIPDDPGASKDLVPDGNVPMTDSHVPSSGESERGSVEQDSATVDSDELTNMHLAAEAAAAAAGSSSPKDSRQASPTPTQQPSYCSPALHGFIFAFHRKTLRVEHYFVSTQKNRSMLFSYPMVVPCLPATPRSRVYDTVYKQVQRLIIPDPPTDQSEEDSCPKNYPFKLCMVSREGMQCSVCPWYRFCRGCPIECNDQPFGNDAHYLAIDWDESFLHLKYQSALEKPIDHESMEDLKTVDTTPIDVRDCFRAFSEPEELGKDEYWYCKICKDHQPAMKTLEIWRLPPVLIVHIKRFQFNNGRWVKSQKPVRFPMEGLDPKSYVKGEPTENEALPRDDRISPSVANRGLEENPPLSVSSEGDTMTAKPTEAASELHSDVKDETSQREATPGEDRHTAAAAPETDDTKSDGGGEEEAPGGKVTHLDDDLETPGGKTTRIDDVEVEAPGEKAAHNDATQRTAESANNHSQIYDLFAITCHSGVLGGGHYTSFAKNPDSRWFYYNDSSCKETTAERVASESPYMLFYELRGLPDRYKHFRAKKQGRKQDIVITEDDREFEENIQKLRKVDGSGSSKQSRGPSASSSSSWRSTGCKQQ